VRRRGGTRLSRLFVGVTGRGRLERKGEGERPAACADVGVRPSDGCRLDGTDPYGTI
jgi:hypothetical protein